MPPSNFSGSPLRGFRRISYTNGGSLCQAFLAETVETERGRSHAFFAKKA